MDPVEICPVTGHRLADLADLFDSNSTTRHCWCTYFLLTKKECDAGWWNGGNRTRFEELARTDGPPAGLLAYRDGRPVGWCSVGPRMRYARVMNSRVLADRDMDDDGVWFVPCSSCASVSASPVPPNNYCGRRST